MTSNETGDDDFEFRIPLVVEEKEEEEEDRSNNGGVGDFCCYCYGKKKKKHLISKQDIPSSWVENFQNDGFIVVPNAIISRTAVNTLNDRLEDVLRGNYDRGKKPDKAPRLLKGKKPTIQPTTTTTTTADLDEKGKNDPNSGIINSNSNKNNNKNKKKKKREKEIGAIGFSGNYQNVRVLQVINIHKADSVYRQLETDPNLCTLVATLAGWEQGARLAQDQVWAKPPGAPPLVFHRDTPYFMFDPPDVVTVWLALDDMDEELGPLEYVRGSHKWGNGRIGSASQFFQSTNTKHLVESAAELEGIHVNELEYISLAGITAGQVSIHNGLIWHGSGKNKSTSQPRRGLGLHFVPANVKFTKEAEKSSLWKSYINSSPDDNIDPSQVELPEEDFPSSSSSSGWCCCGTSVRESLKENTS